VKRVSIRAALAAALVGTAAAAPLAAQQQYDVLIRGGTVVDGTGAPGYAADVAILGDRIARVSRTPIDPALARRVLDARGRIVAPGFIDAHAHVESLDERPLAESFLRQGVTTVVYAPDGGMPSLPLRTHVDRLRAAGHAPNTTFFAGHNTIRSRVMGSANRAPTAAELEEMKALVAAAMADGAIGLSTGLRYVPGTYSTTDEVIALAQVAARAGGIYASHMRDEGAGSLDAVREVIRIAREAGLPAQVSHHKLMGQPQWGQSVQTLALVDSARAAGLDVTIDQYPYDATSTGTAVLFPTWALAGGGDSLRARLADPATRARIEQGIRETIVEERGGGELSRIRIARYGPNPAWNGKTFADIAAERGRQPDMDFAVALAVEIQTAGGASGVWHVVHEDDIRRIMKHPWTMISSDGGIGVPGHGHPHPRNYGAHARLLGRYVREWQVLPLEEAIRKMTSLPAMRIHQPDRGRLADGAFADVVVFDAATIIDRATYEDPHQFAVGVDHVLVNGTLVLHDGSLTGAKPGRILTLATN
jgi:N-acyl-D-amino-acid deacylase